MSPLEFIVETFSLNGVMRSRVSVYQEEKLVALNNMNLDSQFAREKFAKHVSKKTGCELQKVEFKLLELVEKQLIAAETESDETSPDFDLSLIPDEIKPVAEEMLKSTDLFEIISDDIETMGLAGEKNLSLLLYLMMTSRLLDKPLSGIVQGASSSGKSYTINKVGDLMPPETIVRAHDFTDESFYYMAEGSLQHKIIVSGEREHDYKDKSGRAESNSKAFREMVADGVLRKCVTTKGHDGKLETRHIEQPGPIAYIESSTATTIHDEDATRLLSLVSDESTAQTKNIINAIRLQAQGYGSSSCLLNDTKQKHWAAQRMLEPIEITIPFIDSLNLPLTKLSVRRSYGHLVSTIKTVAFLRQFQKKHHQKETGQDYLKADEVDYQVAYQLLKSVLSRTFSSIPQKSCDLVQEIQNQTSKENGFEQNWFTIVDVANWIACSETETRRRLKPLTACGIIGVDESTRPYRYSLDKPDQLEMYTVDIGLPDPEEISERLAIMEDE